jgi:hypothetical protein
MTRKLIAFVSTAVLSLVILYPTVHNGFLSDDFLDLNHRFSTGTFTQTEAGGFRPLIVAVWAFDSVMWGGGDGTWSPGWHITNLLIHLLNIVLVYVFLGGLGLSREARFWGVLLFAVSWAVVPGAGRVSGRTTMLATAPMLMALSLHSVWLRRGKPVFLVLSCLSFLVSLLFKETMLLCAPLFGLAALAQITPETRSNPGVFIRSTLAFLAPTALYVAWRVVWTGPFQNYQDASFAAMPMLRNLADLAVMPFSPWFDSIPARLLIAAFLLLFFLVPGRRAVKAFVAGLLVFPVATVLILPPRPDFAYAALPFAAFVTALVAERVKGLAGRVVLGLFILGCALAARDEVSRLVQAGSYTKEVIGDLDELARSVEPDSVVFVSGIRYDEAGYGTLWPNAFDASLLTIGSNRGGRMFTPEVFWEVAWPVLERDEDFCCVFARMGREGWATRRLSLTPESFPSVLPDVELPVRNGCRVGVTRELRQYSTLLVPGAGPGCSIALADPFNPCSLIAIEPALARGDTAVFDLSGQESWLLGQDFLAIGSGSSVRSVVFTSEKLWLSELLALIAAKREQLPR